MNTPRVVTDQQQRVVWRWENQEPFGNNPPEENPSGLGEFIFPLRFPGTYADRETGTLYNWHRDLDPATGGYLQPEPLGVAGGINPYLYVGGNPVSRSDPRGLDNPGMGPYGPSWGASSSGTGSNPCTCQTGPRWPDFFSVNVNVAIPTPWTGTLFGVTGAWTVDRYGKMYWGAGPNVGKAVTVASGSAAVGWLNQSCKPAATGLDDFLSGHGVNVGGRFWAGAAATYSPSTGGTATSVGFFTPQAGAGYTYSWRAGTWVVGIYGQQLFTDSGSHAIVLILSCGWCSGSWLAGEDTRVCG